MVVTEGSHSNHSVAARAHKRSHEALMTGKTRCDNVLCGSVERYNAMYIPANTRTVDTYDCTKKATLT